MTLPSHRTDSSGRWHRLLHSFKRLSQKSKPVPADTYTSTTPTFSEAEHIHPSDFGSTYARLLTQTFDCAFLPPMDDAQALVPLALYIERVVRAAELSFAVTIASLIILQRLYTRLPPDAYARRAEYSPHLLFAGAYVLAARQYIRMMTNVDEQRVKAQRANKRSGANVSTDQSNKLSNSSWASIAGYGLTEIAGMQENIAYILGRNVVVFPTGEPSIPNRFRAPHSFPMQRNLPLQQNSTLQNLSRMTSEDLHTYFVNGGQAPSTLQSDCKARSLLNIKLNL